MVQCVDQISHLLLHLSPRGFTGKILYIDSHFWFKLFTSNKGIHGIVNVSSILILFYFQHPITPHNYKWHQTYYLNGHKMILSLSHNLQIWIKLTNFQEIKHKRSPSARTAEDIALLNAVMNCIKCVLNTTWDWHHVPLSMGCIVNFHLFHL